MADIHEPGGEFFFNFKLFETEAAEDLRQNRKEFEANVKRSLSGGTLKGVKYDNVLATN